MSNFLVSTIYDVLKKLNFSKLEDIEILNINDNIIISLFPELCDLFSLNSDQNIKFLVRDKNNIFKVKNCSLVNLIPILNKHIFIELNNLIFYSIVFKNELKKTVQKFDIQEKKDQLKQNEDRFNLLNKIIIANILKVVDNKIWLEIPVEDSIKLPGILLLEDNEFNINFHKVKNIHALVFKTKYIEKEKNVTSILFYCIRNKKFLRILLENYINSINSTLVIKNMLVLYGEVKILLDNKFTELESIRLLKELSTNIQLNNLKEELNIKFFFLFNNENSEVLLQNFFGKSLKSIEYINTSYIIDFIYPNLNKKYNEFILNKISMFLLLSNSIVIKSV